MKPREKRTSTEPGLGKVAGDARKTSVRERLGRTSISSSPPEGGDGADDRDAADRDEERVARAPTDRPPSGPPISAPAPSSPSGFSSARRPGSGSPPSARHTRALERPVIARDDVSDREEPGQTSSREEMPFDRLEQLERMERTRQDRTETPRSPGVTAKPPAPAPSRPAPSRPSPSPPSRSASSIPPVSHRSQRPIEGRPVRTSSKPPSGGARGGGRPSQRAPRLSGPPSGAPPPVAPTLRPKSQRTSIRVDDLGDGVGQVTAAVDVAARQVPRLLKTKDEIAAAPIDHRAGFLLAHIDGTMSVQGLVDIASMPEHEVHEILERLRRLGIVALR